MHTSGIDTHGLAVAAGKQADAAKAQSEQAKVQTEKMKESIAKTDDLISATDALAREAKRSADAVKSSADIAQNQLEMSERPWIVTEYTASAPLEFTSDGGATFEVTGKITNIGHSIALLVHDSPLMMLQEPGASMFHPTVKQKKTCDLVRHMGDEYHHGEGTETLLPQEFAYERTRINFTKDQVEKAENRENQ